MHYYLAVLTVLIAGVSASALPNIIVVMPDDMGYGDIGATGNAIIRTPNLDRLSGEGAELTDFYVSPVCSPTRASLMTGRYNYRTRCIDTFKGRSMVDPEEVTIAESLKSAGYTTGIFGKWHLGDNYPLRPQDQGFDEVLIHRAGGLAQPSDPIENDRRYTDPILFRNGDKVKAKGYCTDVYFDAAIDFMKSAKKAGKPFFAYIPPNAPHAPYHDVPEDLLAYYKSIDLTPILGDNTSDKHKDTVARVFAMIENIDQNMGELDNFLKNDGLFEDTLVVFFTDNGPNTARFVGPFRGMKAQVNEGGIRTMCYARWPEGLAAGTKSDRVAAHIDIMPTLLDIAGATPTSEMDGVSVLPLLQGRADQWPERRIFIQSHRGNEPLAFHHFAVRDQDWKLMRDTNFGKETRQDKPEFELYHISKDPKESNNLAKENPEKLEELKSAYSDWLADVSSTRDGNYEPPRIIIGDELEPSSDLSIQDWRVPTGARGWGENGKWMVNFAAAGNYTATFKWEKPMVSTNVVLKVDDQQWSAEIPEGSMEFSFVDVNASKGDSTVSVNIGDGKIRTPILRVVNFSK